jgi:transcriptional regulator with XRE-family HTH domain
MCISCGKIPPMTTLKEWRLKKAINIRELSALTKVSTTTISHIEQGKQVARPLTRRKIANALGLKPEEIDFT